MRATRIEIWLPPDELDRVRAVALLRGFKRKSPGQSSQRGNVSALIRNLLDRLQAGKSHDSLDTLSRNGWTLASLLDVDSKPVRVPIRCSPQERDELKAHAQAVGMMRGGQGDVSAFLRALLRLECQL